MEEYKPVNCDFYDDLEAYSILKKELEILYENEEGETITIFGRIIDIYSKDRIEYMLLDSGKEIALTQLVRVDNKFIDT